MKKTIIKIIVCIVVFFATLFISINVYNQRNTDMTAEMEVASLPLVHMEWDGIEFNTLHGLTQNTSGVFLRETLTPLGENRKLTFVVEKYGNDIDEIIFEVRNIDGTRLVENTTVNQYFEDENIIRATISVKDLIEKDTEYNWFLLVKIGDETIRYCTRIMDVSDYFVSEKLAFVRDFHEKTFDKESVKEVANYMETNSKGDNTTLSHVDIHCNLNQLSWGDIKVSKMTNPQITIREIDETTASITMNYIVKSLDNKNAYYYNVNEYYRIRYSKTRMYLLDYQRDMNQIFDPSANIYASNKIMLGIRNENVQMKESDGGSNVAFVNEKQLFCYHAADKKIAKIFSFYDDFDMRTFYDHHDIKILNVDETGNVSFLVYGYMNRGTHEGKVGISVYEYNGMLNHIEEQVFIPYEKTYATLKSDVEKLSYLNKNGIYYLYLDGYILAVDLVNQVYTVVADSLQEGSFQVSDDGDMLVWQNAYAAYECTRLILMNLNTGTQREISTVSNNRMKPLGFMNGDLIYGVAHTNDIMTDASGSITFPMYVIYIQNEQGDILKSYEPAGIYITDSQVSDNMISLERVKKDESGNSYISTVGDQIVNNIVKELGQNTIEVVATQNYEKIVQIALKNEIQSKNLKVTVPKEIIFEGERILNLSLDATITRYYVYGKNGIDAAYTRPADAINLANTINGTVVDENGKYIWKKAVRHSRNQIMKIKGRATDETSSELAVCLETVMDYYGYSIPVQSYLNQGISATEILMTYLPDLKTIELEKSKIDAVLYYTDKDIPVIINMEGEETVLLLGYNEVSVVIMEPSDGSLKKISMNEVQEMLDLHGTQCIICIPYK